MTTISSKRLFRRTNGTGPIEVALVCRAKMIRSKLPVVVLTTTSTSEFTVMPLDDFEYEYEPHPYRTSR